MRVFLILLLLNITISFGQNSIPKDYFMNPMNIPLVVSGTFGELRSNHFHSGLDLKTQQKEGMEVFASASGSISRIKISNKGYGKALYIQHPNGYTTVYAHLQKFAPEIEAYVKKRQYAKGSYQIEIFPKSGQLSVKKGSLIAFSGNSGGSGGPHLHFEIRDARSRPMNALSFGIDVKDTKKPIVNSLWAYSIKNNSHINQNQKPQKLRLIPQKDGSFKTENIKAFGKIGFAVSTIDHQDLASNKNGVYSIESSVNGQKNFEIEMKRFSFAETRYLNRLIDYKYYKKYRSRITKLFIEPNNPLSVYNDVVDKGFITVDDKLSYNVTIQIKDYKENTTTIHVPIEGVLSDEITKKETPTTGDFVKHNDKYTYSNGIFDLYIPKGSLYEDAYLSISTKGDTIKIHRDEIPLHKNMTIAVDVSGYSEADKKKLYIGRLGYKNHYHQSTTKKGNRFTARTRTLGTYSLFIDTKKPTITPINVKDQKWMSKYQYLKMKISDNDSGVRNYKATINGKFILMEYDYKTGMLIYDFNDNIVEGTENKFKLIVLDNVGNSTKYEATFFRKQ